MRPSLWRRQQFFTIASMDAEAHVGAEERAALHRALSEPARVVIVDALAVSDRSPGELRELTGLEWNLLEFHLGSLQRAGLVQRHVSQGDRRRRYVRLRSGALEGLQMCPRLPTVGVPLFVCTHNSARSQFAAALWRQRTGGQAGSAGSHPAAVVHPLAVQTAAVYDVDLTGAIPRGYDEVGVEPDVVVSVCDRAREGGVPFGGVRLHWSVPDPATAAEDRAAFEAAFADIAERVFLLAGAGA